MFDKKEIDSFCCDVFRPDTADLSEKELKVKLKRLFELYPYNNFSDGTSRPVDPGSEYPKKWFQCYDHLLKLLEIKRQDSKFKLSLIISITALIISAITAGVRFFLSS